MVNEDSISLAELREKVNAELAAAKPASEPAPAPVAEPTPAAEPTPEPAAVAPTETPAEQPKPAAKFTKTIDVDGQMRTFEGATREELIEKLAEAQASVVRKLKALREQKIAATPETAPVLPQPTPTLSADELFQISQEITTDPAAAFGKLMKAQLGLTPDQLRAAIANVQAQQAAFAERMTAEAWVRAHPDYIVSERNAKYLLAAAKQRGGLNYETLDAAYEELKSDGVLQLRQSDPPPNTKSSSVPAAQPHKPVLTGVPVSNAPAPTQPDSDAITAEMAEKMPLSDLRAKLQQMALAGRLS